jgi:hypothetical protein
MIRTATPDWSAGESDEVDPDEDLIGDVRDAGHAGNAYPERIPCDLRGCRPLDRPQIDENGTGVEGDLLGGPLHRQVAGDRELDRIADLHRAIETID